MIARSKKEKESLREGGKRLSNILDEIIKEVKIGVTTIKLDSLAHELIITGGDAPSFLNYVTRGASTPYPGTLCVSINDEIVHGVRSDRELVDGDIIGLDIGLIHNGFFLDMAKTIPVGTIKDEIKELIEATKRALNRGIGAAKVGNSIGDIGYAIAEVGNQKKYGIVRELGGHGVGGAAHEKPFIPNHGVRGEGEKIVEGMVLALEPMFNIGSPEVILDKDGFTYRTKDNSISAHFEDTILVNGDRAEILTQSN